MRDTESNFESALPTSMPPVAAALLRNATASERTVAVVPGGVRAAIHRLCVRRAAAGGDGIAAQTPKGEYTMQ